MAIALDPNNYLLDTRPKEERFLSQVQNKILKIGDYTNSAITVSQKLSGANFNQGANFGYGYVAPFAPTSADLSFRLDGKKIQKVENVSAFNLSVGVELQPTDIPPVFGTNFTFPFYFNLFRVMPRGTKTASGSDIEAILCYPMGNIVWDSMQGYLWASDNPSVNLDLFNVLSSEGIELTRNYVFGVGIRDFSNTSLSNKNNQISRYDYENLLEYKNGGSSLVAMFTYDPTGLTAPQISHIQGTLVTKNTYQLSNSLTFYLSGMSASYSPVAKAQPKFLFAAHQNTTETMFLYDSVNGEDFTALSSNPVYTASTPVRDPTVLFYNNRYYACYTKGFGTTTNFDIAVSDDLLNWQYYTTVDCSSYIGVVNTWAPHWFIDNGQIYILVSLSLTGNLWTIFYVQPSSPDLSTWNNPVQIIWSSPQPSNIDAVIVKLKGVYNMFYSNVSIASPGDLTARWIGLATSTSPFSGYVIKKTGDWTGWGTSIEGPDLIQINEDTWRIYFDKFTAQGIYYSDSKDEFETWSPKRLITTNLNFIPSHTSIIRYIPN